jgi:hypothetical protein
MTPNSKTNLQIVEDATSYPAVGERKESARFTGFAGGMSGSVGNQASEREEICGYGETLEATRRLLSRFCG